MSGNYLSVLATIIETLMPRDIRLDFLKIDAIDLKEPMAVENLTISPENLSVVYPLLVKPKRIKVRE